MRFWNRTFLDCWSGINGAKPAQFESRSYGVYLAMEPGRVRSWVICQPQQYQESRVSIRPYRVRPSCSLLQSCCMQGTFTVGALSQACVKQRLTSYSIVVID